MSVFIELVTEPINNTMKTFGSPRRAGAERVRRPLRGLEIKEDTYGVLKVIRLDGSPIPLFDQSDASGKADQTSSFIIQSVQEARMEKHQIIETFGDSYIFFFGEAPRFIDVTSVLVNSNDFNWEAEWWENYDQYLRGTKSVELSARTYLFYDDSIVEGFMLQAQSQKLADQPLVVSLNFRLFVTNYRNVSLVGDPNFPIRASVVLPDGVPSLQSTMNSEQINALVGSTSGFEGGFAQGGFDLSSGGPLRSKVADNVDEFTGPIPDNSSAFDKFTDFFSDIVTDLEHVADLMQQSITRLAALGAEVDNPAFMQAMGLGPNFNFSSGISIGAGARFNGGASFGVGGSAGFGASASASASFTAGASASAGAGFGGSFGGGFVGFTASAGAEASAFASSSARTSTFATAGVSAGASYGGAAGVGASVMVGGSPSAFALASFEGEFDNTAQATAFASASVGT